MMFYCIMILTVGAVLHFVYESIVAPSFRLELRFELFKLRDEARFLKIESLRVDSGRPEFVEQHFCDLQDSINALICILYRFDLVTVCAISEEIDRDAGLKQRVEIRSRILDDCVLPEVMAIRSKQFRLAATALAVNSGPMLIWLAVPTSLFSGYKAVRNKIKNSLTVPGADLKRFIPEESPIGAGLTAQ